MICAVFQSEDDVTYSVCFDLEALHERGSYVFRSSYVTIDIKRFFVAIVGCVVRWFGSGDDGVCVCFYMHIFVFFIFHLIMIMKTFSSSLSEGGRSLCLV